MRLLMMMMINEVRYCQLWVSCHQLELVTSFLRTLLLGSPLGGVRLTFEPLRLVRTQFHRHRGDEAVIGPFGVVARELRYA